MIVEKTWKDITLDQFIKIGEFMEVKDDYTMCNIIDTIWNVDSANMPISEFKEYKNALKFMNDDIKPDTDIPSEITLNGHSYQTSYNLTEVKTAQYIDFQNYLKKDNVQYKDLLSVFVIPAGHNYNDGYDLNEVKSDIMSMPITQVYGLSFFLTVQFQAFIEIFPSYFREELMTMKIPEERKELILKELDKLDYSHLESFPILLGYVENSVKPGNQ